MREKISEKYKGYGVRMKLPAATEGRIHRLTFLVVAAARNCTSSSSFIVHAYEREGSFELGDPSQRRKRCLDVGALDKRRTCGECCSVWSSLVPSPKSKCGSNICCTHVEVLCKTVHESERTMKRTPAGFFLMGWKSS